MMNLKAKSVKLSLDSVEYQRLLKKGEDSFSIHSGFVTLKPGESIGAHSTDGCEEIIIVLEGKGELLIENSASFKMKDGFVFYCPPRTLHNVTNAGDQLLKYIYVTAAVNKNIN